LVIENWVLDGLVLVWVISVVVAYNYGHRRGFIYGRREGGRIERGYQKAKYKDKCERCNNERSRSKSTNR
jgi:hypothetical protein